MHISSIKKRHGSTGLFGLLFILTAPLFLSAQSADIKFEHLSVEDGLSSNTVRCVIQDQTEFMWFGTHNGLCRYDGNKFTVYKHDAQDSTTLSESWINCMAEDGDGYLWIGTDGGGLNRYDPELEIFTRWIHDSENPASLPNNVVMSVFIDEADRFWVGTKGGGLSLFDRENNTFRSWSPDPSDSTGISGEIVRAICRDRAGVLWVGTENNGLNRVFEKDGELTFQRYTTSEIQPALDFVSKAIWSIYEDREHYLWIGTSNGIARFNPDRTHIEHFYHHWGDPASLSEGQVRAFFQDPEGDFWIAMFPGGLNKFIPGSRTFLHYTREENNPSSLNNEYALDVLGDQSGLIWVATRDGISRFDARENTFDFWLVSGGGRRDLHGGSIRAIYEDSRGNAWFGSDGALNKYSADTGVRIQPNSPDGIVNEVRIRAIYEDREGMIWLGTEGHGLNRLDPETGIVRQWLPDPADSGSVSSVYVRSIFEDEDGFLWIGTQEGGLNRFDRSTGKFEHWLHHPSDTSSLNSRNVQVIYQDREGLFWLGTDDGLNCFDPLQNQFRHWCWNPDDPASLSHNKIRAIHEDSDGVLWIGTRGGFNRFDRQTGKFKRFHERDGLPSDVIFGILEDKNQTLWLSTPGGLSRFNPSDESFNNVKVPYNFKFDMGASFRNKDGKMYFGGVAGAIAFHPDSIQLNEHVPPVVITTFKIFDKVVELSRSVSRTDEVLLTHTDTHISFEFAALDYMNPGKNQYAYRLDGFDSDWNYCGNRSFASYTNLDPGDYVFRVKGSNDAGVWSQKDAVIKVVIKPPFWETLWFRMTSVFSVVLLVVSLFQNRTMRIRARNRDLENINQELNENIKKRQAAEDKIKASLKEKEVLLKEVHHRVKNNLQIISSLLSLECDHINERDPVDVLIESRNRVYSMALVHELLYNSEDLESIDIREYSSLLAKRLHSNYRDLNKPIELILHVDEIILDIDRAIPCGLLINELLSNAFEHAFPDCWQGEGRVELSFIQKDDNACQIHVSDNGIGMPSDYDYDQAQSLGLRLVHILAKDQLQGMVTVSNDGGTSFQIEFRKTPQLQKDEKDKH